MRVGDFVSLDTMKRQYNDLHWSYIGPSVLDDSLRVRVIAECICIEESFESYCFVMESIFAMVPARSRSAVKAIFGDLIMSTTLLEKLGIEDTCSIFWDHFHLKKRVWKPYFGPVRYAQLEKYLQRLIDPSSQTCHLLWALMFLKQYRSEEVNCEAARLDR
jgi:hypothetical protein